MPADRLAQQAAAPAPVRRLGRPPSHRPARGDDLPIVVPAGDTADRAQEDLRRRRFNVMLAGEDFIVWFYRDRDHTVAQVAAPGYLAFGADMLGLGDHIHLCCKDGGALAEVHRLRPVELRIMCSSVPERRASAAAIMAAITTAVAEGGAA